MGLNRKGNKNDPTMKERQTRMEKKISRMQAAWREEEKRRKEKEEEARDLAEEEDAANLNPWDHSGETRKSNRGKGGKGSQTKESDLWSKIQARNVRPSGLHDVVEAPPEFTNIPKEKFKVKNNAKVEVTDVPKAAGSLRQREELGDTRRSVIESYRKLMGDRRRGADSSTKTE